MKQFAKLFGDPEDQFLVTKEEDPVSGIPCVRYQRPHHKGHGTFAYVVECRDWQHADELFAAVNEERARTAFDNLVTQAGAFDELERQAHG